jgi:cellulose synthase/poly-beta-1,6-N-acetylglucosamine synthase-like glycosyltransferase
VIFEFQRSGMAAVCPRIAVHPDGLLARFQSLEYHMSFALGRRSLGSHTVNSGASIYRRRALEQALSRHTQSVYGEDFQISVLLLGAGEQIYYDGRLVFQTSAKRCWRDWFSQRVGWYYGLLSVYARHLPSIWRVMQRSPSAAYHFGFYTGVVVLLAHPIRVAALAVLAMSGLNGLDTLVALNWIPDSTLTDPVYAASVLGTQTALACAALVLTVPRGERLYLLPAVPLYALYALAHVAPVTVGYLNWLSLRTIGARVWGDHYQDETSLRAELAHQRALAVE